MLVVNGSRVRAIRAAQEALSNKENKGRLFSGGMFIAFWVLVASILFLRRFIGG